jgi:hypothetical protein
VPKSSEFEVFTFAAWIKTTPQDREQTIAARRDKTKPANMAFRLLVNSHGSASLGVYGPSGYGEFATSKKRVDDKQWHHIAGTFDGASITIFVDGKYDGYVGHSAKPNFAGHQELVIGNDPAKKKLQLTGFLADVRMYSRALSEKEISALAANAP